MLEIERKFLLVNLAPGGRAQLETSPLLLLVQDYLPAGPACSIRLRVSMDLRHPQFGWRHALTVKSDTDHPWCRQEYEVELTYAAWWKLHKQATKMLTKRRTVYTDPDTGATWLLDEILQPTGLTITLAEAELSDPEAAWPAFPKLLQPLLVREVTDEPQYRSENLAWPLSTTNQENLSCCSTPNPS